jgi:cytoskeletal protein CcmA (bactofilin family)
MVARTVMCALWLGASSVFAQQAGETVVTRGTVKEDLYLAGGSVTVAATVEGDIVTAGGHVMVGDDIQGDVIAAGGTVTVSGKVRDDLRAAGGTVMINADIGDDAIAAGGTVVLAPSALVNGRAWLAGGKLDIGGRIRRELRAAGGNIALGAEVQGDVTLTGESIDIGPRAVIHGNLRYLSPNEARIDKDARITGSVTRLPFEPHAAPRLHRGGARLGVMLSLMVTGAVLVLLFPSASSAAASEIGRAPWKSLGLGLALLTATPLVIVLLFASVLGAWLGLILLAAYLVALLVGFLTGALFVGEAGLRLARREEAGKAWRIAALVAALLVAGVLGFVPVVGGLVTFALLLFGLGALALYGYRLCDGGASGVRLHKDRSD